MMSQEMPHDDQEQDASMIKQVLQKIIDEMDGMEADRIHPKMAAMKLEVESPKEDMQEGGVEESEGLDPEVLKTLLAGTESSQDETDLAELPPSIADAVRSKKKLK